MRNVNAMGLLSESSYYAMLLVIYYLVAITVFSVLPDPSAEWGFHLVVGFHPPSDFMPLLGLWMQLFMIVFCFKSVARFVRPTGYCE